MSAGRVPCSPKTRAIEDLDSRAERLEAYESWKPPTRLDFAALSGARLWADHWDNHRQLMDLMRTAQATATAIREAVRPTYLATKGEAQ